MYLERIVCKSGIKGYYADVEYNRNKDGRVKTILNKKMEVVTINCDLILHSRGNNTKCDNLIAIEMKKVIETMMENNLIEIDYAH